MPTRQECIDAAAKALVTAVARRPLRRQAETPAHEQRGLPARDRADAQRSA